VNIFYEQTLLLSLWQNDKQYLVKLEMFQKLQKPGVLEAVKVLQTF